ncbi:hypothetical protein [Nonomuraea sp. SYSU D8015]|uniref:hypothetical protein n=1 Tax=Nonomuraea sp. SYSU D8015 TaxID=2593644 RepID=UPI00166032ED|nr:hypothetical protein [Nonomuraea sp. SYSU D8015]
MRTRPLTTRRVGEHSFASAGTVGGNVIGSTCQAQPLAEAGQAVRGSFTRSRALRSPVRPRTASCRSAAASTI